MNLVLINIAAFLIIGAYPPVESGIKFNHNLHYVDNSIECSYCHSVSFSESSADKNIPGHDICSDCHSTENAPDDCKLCHVNPDDPTGVTHPEMELIFSHKRHIKSKPESSLCLTCHTDADKMTEQLTSANFPTMDNCFQCHDGQAASAECAACHSRPVEMASLVHEPDWKHEHRYATDMGGQQCTPCHQTESFCNSCHAGDNIVETVHELNYKDSHAIDARGDVYQCQSCHDPQTFCADCHAREGAMPLDHTMSGWALPPYEHAEAARRDVEACAACHSTSDSPICSRCHFDTDGVRGTNPTIHSASIEDIGHGPWHDDPGFQCFNCHISTNTPGVGFCGYCHGDM